MPQQENQQVQRLRLERHWLAGAIEPEIGHIEDKIVPAELSVHLQLRIRIRLDGWLERTRHQKNIRTVNDG